MYVISSWTALLFFTIIILMLTGGVLTHAGKPLGPKLMMIACFLLAVAGAWFDADNRQSTHMHEAISEMEEKES